MLGRPRGTTGAGHIVSPRAQLVTVIIIFCLGRYIPEEGKIIEEN